MQIGNFKLFHRENIVHPEANELYMRRWKLFDHPAIGGIYVHNILLGDQDRHLHDHPFNFTSFILRGSYTEVRRIKLGALWGLATPVIRKAFSVNRVTHFTYHRIADVSPNTWTLVFHGPRTKKWGFSVNGKFVEHTEYLNNWAEYQY